IIILSKNKKGLSANEKQIAHYAILKKIRKTSDEEIEKLWPGNSGRWNYITEFTEVKPISAPFNLSDILEPEQAKHYSSIMTHGRLGEDDEAVIHQRIGFTNLKRLPEEIETSKDIFEGAKKTITINAYERDASARKLCLNHYDSYKCQICEMNFEEIYGELGVNFIHVHHIKPLYTIKEKYLINPIQDLIPVCPNCHAMLHRSNPPLKPDELRVILNERRN
ncbi:MAG TPA: hypothetical protein EYP90_13670, partial [Chromatiaceae bacterium]|nr:hypothetical protein [Chromatiaceae bacterium]